MISDFPEGNAVTTQAMVVVVEGWKGSDVTLEAVRSGLEHYRQSTGTRRSGNTHRSFQACATVAG